MVWVRALWLRVVLAGVLAACAPTYDRPDLARGDPPPPPRAFTARVDRVVDGDTFIARHRGDRLRVRLIGVDAPESVQPGAPVECWGRESAGVLRELLPEGAHVLAAHQTGGRRDRFERQLWDVWRADGRFVQGALVRRGAAVAVAYEPQVAHAGYLATVEARARERGVGLFGACRHGGDT